MLQLILIVKLVTCEMHSKIKFFNQKPTNEIGRPHYTPLVTNTNKVKACSRYMPVSQLVQQEKGQKFHNATKNFFQLSSDSNEFV